MQDEFPQEKIGLQSQDMAMLERFRDEDMAILTGIEREEILTRLPGISEMEQSLLDRLKFVPSAVEGVKESAERAGFTAEEVDEVWKEENRYGQDKYTTDEIKEKLKVPPVVSKKVGRHWRRLVRELPKGGGLFYKAGSGIVIVESPAVPSDEIQDMSRQGDRVYIAFDLREDKFDRHLGIPIVGIYQSSTDGSKVVDILEFAEGTRVFFKDNEIWLKILTLGTIRNKAAGIDSKISFSKGEDGLNVDVEKAISIRILGAQTPEIIAHETQHVRDFREAGEHNILLAGLSKLFTDISILGGVSISIITMSPFFALIPLLWNIGCYFLAKDKNNALGDSYYYFMETEVRAYLMGEIHKMLLQRNGFGISPMYVKRDLKSIPITQPVTISQGQFDIAYQPLFFTLIDKLLGREGAPKPQEPEQKPALAGI